MESQAKGEANFGPANVTPLDASLVEPKTCLPLPASLSWARPLSKSSLSFHRETSRQPRLATPCQRPRSEFLLGGL